MTEEKKFFQEINENLTCIQHGGGWKDRMIRTTYGWTQESWWQKCRQSKCPACDRRAK